MIEIYQIKKQSEIILKWTNRFINQISTISQNKKTIYNVNTLHNYITFLLDYKNIFWISCFQN